MKQFAFLAVLTAAVVGGSAVAGAVRANEMAAKTIEQVQSTPVELATPSVISAAELQTLIDTEEALVIVDSRQQEQFSTGHIPGAVSLRANTITAEHLATLAPQKDNPLVFYCGNTQCLASGKTAHKAAEQGYTRLYVYAEGIEDWQAKGLPVVTE